MSFDDLLRLPQYSLPQIEKEKVLLQELNRLDRHHHAGLILRADSANRIEDLIAQYTDRFLEDFCAVVPPPDKPTA